MKRILKILLGLLASLIVLLVLAGVILPLVYDKEDLKQAIASEVHKQTGRELRIDGALNFSVFPWLAVEVGDLQLSNAAGFGDQPFASISKARIGVALLPLFKKQLVADEITLDGLQLALAVNAKGKNNWDDLVKGREDRAADATASQGAEAGLLSSPRIAGLNIRDARIEYRDRPAGVHYRMDHFSVETGALGDAKPVAVKLDMQLEDLTAGSRWNIVLATKAALDFKAETYRLDDVNLTTTPLAAANEARREAIDFRAPRLEASLAAETLNLEKFTASLAGVEATGSMKASKILHEPRFDGQLQLANFSPRKLMQALSIEPPPTQDPDVLQRARLSVSLKGDKSQLTLGDFQLELDQSNFKGEMTVRHFDRPSIRFDLGVDAIDLDRYLEPAADNKAAAASDVIMPKEQLRNLDVQGTLRAGSLKLAGLDFSKTVVGLNISNGKLRLNPLTAGFYDGSYNGNITLDSSGAVPTLSLDEKLDSVTLKSLLAAIANKQNLSGMAQAFVRLNGRGTTSSEVLKSLNGDVGMTLKEGALEGVNVWYEIRRGYALYKGLPAPEPEPDRTVFSRVKMDGTVENGVLETRELIADLPFLAVRGDGAIDLAKSNVDLKLTAIVSNAPELQKDPLASGLKGKKLPFKVSGPLAGPKVSVDWAELLKSEAAGMLLDKLGLKPKSAAKEETAPSDGGKQNLSSGDKTKEAAKGLLFDLLGGQDKNKDKKQPGDSDGGR